MTSFEARKSVFKKANENNSFLVVVVEQGQYNSKSVEKTIDDIQKILALKSQNDIELHVKEVKKKRNQTKIRDNEHKLSNFDTQKKRDT